MRGRNWQNKRIKMRTRYSAEQKAKLVLEALRGERTVQQIASENNIAPNLLTRWKSEAISNLPQLFENENNKLRKQAKNHEVQVEELYTQIGRLTTGLSWLKKNLVSKYTSRERLEMMSQDDEISIRQQANLLSVNRSTFYIQASIAGPYEFVYQAFNRRSAHKTSRAWLTEDWFVA